MKLADSTKRLMEIFLSDVKLNDYASFYFTCSYDDNGELSCGYTFTEEPKKTKGVVQQLPPVYKHNCDACKYLGHYEGRDLYFCADSHKPTVIARYGDGEDEFSSGLNFATPTGIKWLYEAKLRAIKLGLIEKPTTELPKRALILELIQILEKEQPKRQRCIEGYLSKYPCFVEQLILFLERNYNDSTHTLDLSNIEPYTNAKRASYLGSIALAVRRLLKLSDGDLDITTLYQNSSHTKVLASVNFDAIYKAVQTH